MKCQAVVRCVDAVVDEEVDASMRLAVEEHTSSCSACRERVDFARWMKSRLQQDGKLAAPEALRLRVQEAMAREASGGSLFSGLLPSFARLESSWRATAAMAAMALVVFGIGGALELKGQRSMARIGPLFEDVVRAHTRPYPAEVARRDLVPAYFADKVDFAVQPVDFSDPAVRFVGARHAEVGGRHAVSLQYEARGRKMTVVAFRPPAHALENDVGERVDTSGRRMRYVHVGSHMVPLVEHGGVVYAVVGDLEPEDGMRLASQAEVH
ncbi:MAG: putative transrane anti-sigma factor [Myxococcaceae bacterium]|nr:putative transrane anti-sigma factor [Myxococcaceae bacterium]